MSLADDILSNSVEVKDINFSAPSYLCKICNTQKLSDFCPRCLIEELVDEISDLNNQVLILEDLLDGNSKLEQETRLASIELVAMSVEKYKFDDLMDWINAYDTLPDLISDMIDLIIGDDNE